MQGKHWFVVAFLILATTGCKELNREYYCPGHPDDLDCGRQPDKCGDIMCAAPTPVCEQDTTTCVQCVENSDCSPALPVCTDQHMCVQCQVDDDCDSKLCLVDGKCAAPEDVTYVGGATTSDNPTCSIDTPCQNLDQGLKVTPLRKYIKVTGAISQMTAVTIDNKRAIIYGRSSGQISRSTKDEVLIIKGTSDITLIDLDILGNTSTSRNCVDISETATVSMLRVDIHGHDQAGISLSGSGKLTITDSKIHDNKQEGVKATGGTLEIHHSWIYRNTGVAAVLASNIATIESSVIAANTGTYGVSVAGTYTIRNNIISANGNPSSTAAGVLLGSDNSTGIFEFNTVADNATTGPDLGVSCLKLQTTISNNILSNNAPNCAFVTYSLTDAVGIGNKNVLPMFIRVTEPLDPTFYRLMPGSEAKDSADPAATLNVDIDGDPRNDARKDIGADELR